MPYFQFGQKEPFDDRRPVWNQSGKLPVARRRVMLRAALAEHGILNYSSPEVAEKLGQCSLAELRRIHTYTSGGTVGAMNMRLERASGNGPLVDARDSRYTAPLQKGDTYLDLDFRPFNVHHKIGDLATAGVYFLFTDMGRAIDAVNDSGAAVPPVVTGSTNRTMAKILTRRLGYHPFGARVTFDDQVYEVGGQQAGGITTGAAQETLAAAQADAELHVFMRTEDFFGDEHRALCVAGVATTQSRLMQPGESPEALEVRLRATAIDVSLQAMHPTDLFRLSRHTTRRDLVHTEITGVSAAADARREIASWPQIQPDQFVPPDYYAK